MGENPYDDRPWTEDEWERFMQKSETRSAKFAELLETLMDHPDRDAIIAREMGWQREESPDEVAEDFGLDLPEFPEAEEIDDEALEAVHREGDALEGIPAYARGYSWGLKVHEALKPFFGPLGDSDEPEEEDDLVQAFACAMTVAAKIAGGHGMGYDDESLCGNIVCCKRALEAAEKSLAALESLDEQGIAPIETLRPLIDEGREVRQLVEARIAQLRSRVWWDGES